MREFIAIDFETGNPKRVSACALGYARVVNGQVLEANAHLMKPVGGHAPFQSKIHGITDKHTFDKPDFGQLFPDIRHIFEHTLVAHSLFDRQVLLAVSEHFGINIDFQYFDTAALAKQKLPDLKNHKLKTLAKHFGIPKFRHHDAKEDAIACAHICLRLHVTAPEIEAMPGTDEIHEFKGIVTGILADNEVNYKEAYELLYWLEDHARIASQYRDLFQAIQETLKDDELDYLETDTLKNLLSRVQAELIC